MLDTIAMPAQIHRIKQMAAFLVSDKISDEQFDITELIYQKPCGTVACIAGWTPTVFPTKVRRSPRSAGRTEPLLRIESPHWWPMSLDALTNRVFGFWHDPREPLAKGRSTASPFLESYYNMRSSYAKRHDAARVLGEIAVALSSVPRGIRSLLVPETVAALSVWSEEKGISKETPLSRVVMALDESLCQSENRFAELLGDSLLADNLVQNSFWPLAMAYGDATLEMILSWVRSPPDPFPEPVLAYYLGD